MIDWRQRHLDQARKEQREILLPGATIDQWKSGKWPKGSTWLWALGVVGEKGSAVQPDRRSGE